MPSYTHYFQAAAIGALIGLFPLCLERWRIWRFQNNLNMLKQFKKAQDAKEIDTGVQLSIE